jgi:cell division septation protein DedD
MARETIVVIDADQDLDQRMTAALEAAGYTVFTGPSGVVTDDILKKLAPSLIYVKPLAASRAGFEPCKTIHSNPVLKHIPIVLVASLKGSLDPRFFRIYGIVDSLKPTCAPDELIEKTEMILGKTHPSRLSRQDESIIEKPAGYVKETGAMITEDDRPVGPRGSIEADAFAPAGLTWQEKDEENHQEERPTRTRPWSQAVGGKERKRPSLLLAAVGVVILLIIGGAGFFVYKQLTPPRKVSVSPAVPTPPPVPSKAPEARPEPSSPPVNKTADASASAPPVTQPAQTPSPPSVVSPKPLGKSFYAVQLGIFRNEGNAQTLASGLREKGYDAFVHPNVAKDGSSFYRVLVSRQEDRKAAEKLAEEIRSKEKIETTVYRERPPTGQAASK